MTLQETIQMQAGMIKTLELFAKAANPIVFAAVSASQSAAGSLPLIASAASSLPKMQRSIVQSYASINFDGIGAAMATLNRTQCDSSSDASLFEDSLSQSMLDSLVAALNQAEPYLPPEEKEQCETVIKPRLERRSRTRLTLGDALTILNLLLTIFFFVLGTMPDDQAERIIQQQNKIIANQEAEITQLREDDQALLDTLESLSNNINLLAEKIELRQHELGDINDLADGPNQAEPCEPQQDASDAQD